ncbi:MAG: sugar MFS transporter [Muribaculaceae bacterium]|nr:sugar MFS transporter [Muribaculaceae bacterium]
MQTTKGSLVSRQYILPFILVSSLFFIWGFARSILDVLNKHFQQTMEITIARSSMIQATTYVGYFLMAIPAGLFLTRFGYRKGVITGLLLFAAGAFLFIPCEANGGFEFFLIALFIIGCGLVMLETAANPYITELGEKSTAASRLNLAQAFNGLGCLLAPALVGRFLLSPEGDGSVALPYSIMGAAVVCVALIFTRVKLPEIGKDNLKEEKNENVGATLLSLLKNRVFVTGVGALFFYEIAEISINSLFINYVTSDGWLTPATAAVVLSLGGLGLFFLARVIGSGVMSKVKAEKVLIFCAVMTVIGSLAVILNLGIVSRIGLFSCYAFEAIMFPTIFAISVRGLGSATKLASSLLMMTPLGGAVGTMIMGTVADAVSISTSFAVPCCAYAIVLIYSLTRR